MTAQYLDHERLADLLTQRATEGLSAADEVELEELLKAFPGADIDALDATAAALTLAGDWEEEPLPESVRAKLDAAASGFAAAKLQLVPGEGAATAVRTEAAPLPSRTTRPEWAWFATAAAVVVAVFAWWPLGEEPLPSQVDLITEASRDESRLVQLREQLLESAQPLQIQWTATEDPAAQGVAGDVVWDPETQVGFMRFAGLPANDPGEAQYQLWIFDATRDERYPVDGGVFDIPADGGDVVVPIIAKLPVASPALFAVTVERPGGVVVSSRERIVVVAQVNSG